MRATERLPVREIVPLSVQLGRQDEARAALLACVKNSAWSSPGYPEETIRAIRMVGLDVVGSSLVELGFAADAIPIYREAQGLVERLDPSFAPVIFPQLPDVPRQIAEHLSAAIDGMSGSELAELAGRSIAEAARGPEAEKREPASRASSNDRGEQAIDVMTIVHPRSLDQASIRSLVADSFDASNPTALAGLAGPLESLRQAHPDDLSVAICAALEALASNDAGRIETTLGRLAQVVEKTPLDPLPAGVRANSRQRAQAAGQIPLWLVARAARRDENPSSVRAQGDRFAARALEAAGRQSDRIWLLAMLREQGQAAFDRNERANAAAIWSRMLDMVVTPSEPRPRRPAVNGPGAPGRRAGLPPGTVNETRDGETEGSRDP